MSDRYTKKDAEAAFERFAFVMGRSTEAYVKGEDGRYRSVIGAWTLDANPTYGGYVINEICTDGGGVTQPFGPMRRNARDFCDSIRFALDAINIDRKAR